LTPIVTKISFASFSASRGPPTPKLPRSRPWCLLYPEPKFHADRTILRWDIINRTNKQKTKSKLNITPNATLRYAVWRDNKQTTIKIENLCPPQACLSRCPKVYTTPTSARPRGPCPFLCHHGFAHKAGNFTALSQNARLSVCLFIRHTPVFCRNG